MPGYITDLYVCRRILYLLFCNATVLRILNSNLARNLKLNPYFHYECSLNLTQSQWNIQTAVQFRLEIRFILAAFVPPSNENVTSSILNFFSNVNRPRHFHAVSPVFSFRYVYASCVQFKLKPDNQIPIFSKVIADQFFPKTIESLTCNP